MGGAGAVLGMLGKAAAHGATAIGKSVAKGVGFGGGGGNADRPIDSVTGEVITPDAFGSASDILKPDLAPKVPMWKSAAKGAMVGGLDALQNRQRPYGGPQVSFDVSQATLPADFYQPSTLYTQARKRFDPFYGG